MRRWAGLLLSLTAGTLSAAEGPYRSVRLDDDAQLYIRLADGVEIKVPTLEDQVGFESGAITKNGTTIGWIALYAGDYQGRPLAGRLVLYRNGRVKRSFETEQVFWSWRFTGGDSDVAYCTGPTHGGAASCEVHQVATGKLMAIWDPKSRHKVPAWATGLSY